MSLLMVFSTFPDLETARRVVATLVEENLVACGNLLPAVESIYRWEGKMESSHEVLALLKTTQEAYVSLETRLKALHPYEVPEIVALPVEKVQKDYATWVGQMTARLPA